MIKDYLYLKDGITLEFEYINVFNKKSLPEISSLDVEDDKKIYISKQVDLPRVKLREFLKNKKTTLTTKIENADIIIVTDPSDITDDFTKKREYVGIVKTEELIEQLESLSSKKPELFSALLKELEDYPHPTVATTYHFRSNSGVELDYASNYIKIVEDPTFYEGLLTNYKFCLSSDLLSMIADDSPALTHEQYNQLIKMISGDDDNQVIAMEIMANCNYVKSLHYLCGIFMNHSSPMYHNPAKRHVNFKSLLSFLERDPSRLHIDLPHTVKLLHKNGVLNEETMAFIRDQFLVNASCSHHLDYHNIQAVELQYTTPEIIEVFGKPYTFKVPQDDRES